MKPRPKGTYLFLQQAADLASVRPGTVNTVCCPLCLNEFEIQAINELSVEHIVPSKLGGTTTTLTCRKCNNRQGSRLDRHFVSGMQALDAMEGHRRIKGTLRNQKGLVAIDLTWTPGTKGEPIKLQVIKGGSNPVAIEAIRAQLVDGATIDLRLNLDFIPERYWRAAIRAAYLAVFSLHGYEYAFSKGASHVRSVLNGGAPVQQNVIMEAFPHLEPPSDLLVMPHAFDDLGEFFIVLLRLKTERTRYLTVFLPGKPGCYWNELTRLYKHAPRLRIETTPDTWTSKLFISLDYDPVSKMRTAGSKPRAE